MKYCEALEKAQVLVYCTLNIKCYSYYVRIAIQGKHMQKLKINLQD